MASMQMVKTLIKSLPHPTEVVALVQYAKKKGGLRVEGEELQWCYDVLAKTSRSFAVVIQKLHPELRDPVMVFYLVLRGLDSVEDDMAFPVDRKTELLHTFHECIYQRGWSLDDCGEKEHERELLRNFGKVISVFLSLDEKYQQVIADITKRMGHGMDEFLHRDLVTIEDWDLYCHYVAGLVGLGLSGLFARSELESQWFATADEASNVMGLFLQKTNIIRDYLEDAHEGRVFWPREIWSKYAEEITDFIAPSNSRHALACMNELITNALEHVPVCIDYMSRLREPRVFNFCAIPQAMAIATLARCFNNHQVFEGVVKLRRGESLCMMDAMEKGMPALYATFFQYACEIEGKIDPSDPSAARTHAAVATIKRLCQPHVSLATKLWLQTSTTTVVLAAIGVWTVFGAHHCT